MLQHQGMIEVGTSGPGLFDISRHVRDWLDSVTVQNGLLTLLCQHTSASLTLQENASPEVQSDLGMAFDRLAPRTLPYAHALEGPDDMPAHIRTVLSGVHLSIPVQDGQMVLGTWQGIYLWEHRDAAHQRRVALHLIGS